MEHCNTILSQVLRVFPRHEFEQVRRAVLPKVHRRAVPVWTQFVVMMTGQLTGRDSLRGIMATFSPQLHKLYHLGLDSFSRSSLARASEGTPRSSLRKCFRRFWPVVRPSLHPGKSSTSRTEARSICLTPR